MLMVAAESSQAGRHGGRGSGRGGRAFTGESRAYGGLGRAYGGGSRDFGGRGRTYERDDREYGGGGRAYARGGPAYVGGGRTYAGQGGRYYEGGAPYYGGARYYGYDGYRFVRPRRVISFGIGLGVPHYIPPAYRYYVEPYPVETEPGTSIVTPSQPPPAETEPGPSMNMPRQPPPVETESGTQVDVTNDPPAGCYYYDRFCDRQFANLDDYTEHVESQNHPKTIEIIRKDSGDSFRTLEFVGGYWSVQK
jgi:hypothetical protein